MTEQKHIRLNSQASASVDNWRKQQNPIPNYTKSINTMLSILPQVAILLTVHESDIAASVEDWGQWKDLFKIVLGREPKEEAQK
jgi:hypothetical protein